MLCAARRLAPPSPIPPVDLLVNRWDYGGAMARETDIASLLRDLRLKKGESLRSAARGLGVDPSHLARVEAGDKPLSLTLGQRVTDYYNVEPDHVYVAAGTLPPDVVSILLDHPEELKRIRKMHRPRG